MKNKLLLIVAILISVQSFAQDPELIREWRLLYMEVDGIVHDAPQPEWPWVDPKLDLFYAGQYGAQIDGCDDLLGGTVTYDTPNSSITTSDHVYLVENANPYIPTIRKCIMIFLQIF